MKHTYAFEKLQVWQSSRLFVGKLYSITVDFPDHEKFGITSQIRRAAISIATNLSEGSGRKTKKDKAYFTTVAYSSLMETLNLLIISFDLGYIDQNQLDQLRTSIEEISYMLN